MKDYELIAEDFINRLEVGQQYSIGFQHNMTILEIHWLTGDNPGLKYFYYETNSEEGVEPMTRDEIIRNFRYTQENPSKYDYNPILIDPINPIERKWFTIDDKLQFLTKEQLKELEQDGDLEVIWENGVDNYTCLDCKDCDREGTERVFRKVPG